jgi:lipoate-protein ligase A
MRLLNLTLPTPEENLALEEALSDAAEVDPDRHAVLRIWESPTHFVVAGSASRLADEVVLDACRRDGIAVLRRFSGGGTVLLGPGCLNFAVVLSYDRAAVLGTIDGAFDFVLTRVQRALGSSGFVAERAGISDLCVEGRKVCGSGQRRRRRHVFVHSTVLFDLDLAAVGRYLREPLRRPAYRANRPHAEFMMNLPVNAASVRAALEHEWQANRTDGNEVILDRLRDRVDRLVREKYRNPRWLYRR